MDKLTNSSFLLKSPYDKHYDFGDAKMDKKLSQHKNLKTACRVQILKKSFLQNRERFGCSFTTIDTIYTYLPFFMKTS